LDPVNLILGSFAVGYGVLTLIIRAKNPAMFGKLATMKQQWGDTTGTAIHVIAYSVMPILVGVALLVAGLLGVSFFGNSAT
jgi:hypothetical protein